MQIRRARCTRLSLRASRATLLAGLLASTLVLARAPAAGADGHEGEPAETPPAAAAPVGEVARALFTSAIADREPVDELESAPAGEGELLFFSELIGLAGQTVVHRWEHDGEVMANVSFAVGGDRWRVWSSKKLDARWAGEWTASVVDGDGRVLATHTIEVVVPTAP